MYMLNRAAELFHGEDFTVAHCNFRLRGEESDGDEAFVRDWCTSRDVPVLVNHFDTASEAESKGISIEMAARSLRYGWFAQLCREHGFRAVAVAHNANDNAETLILNLLRGTGSRGARGMSAISPLPESDGEAVLLRPLLGIERREIEEWMKANGCSWREDRTNGESIYKRNLIRNDVFPLFSRINPSFIRTLQRDMENFSQADDIAEDYYTEAFSGITGKCGSALQVSVPGLLSLKHWKFVLWRILEPYGFSFETFCKLTELLERFKNEPRGTVTLGGKKFESPTNILKAGSRWLVIS